MWYIEEHDMHLADRRDLERLAADYRAREQAAYQAQLAAARDATRTTADPRQLALFGEAA